MNHKCGTRSYVPISHRVDDSGKLIFASRAKGYEPLKIGAPSVRASTGSPSINGGVMYAEVVDRLRVKRAWSGKNCIRYITAGLTDARFELSRIIRSKRRLIE